MLPPLPPLFFFFALPPFPPPLPLHFFRHCCCCCCLLLYFVPATKLSVKQSGKAGGWPTFLPIEANWYSAVHSSRCPLLLSPLLSNSPCSPHPGPTHPKPGSLVADWVVIVIKSSCTASEYTKLSANGWSSVGGWPGDWRGGEDCAAGRCGHCPHSLSSLFTQSSLLSSQRSAPENGRREINCNTAAAFES